MEQEFRPSGVVLFRAPLLPMETLASRRKPLVTGTGFRSGSCGLARKPDVSFAMPEAQEALSLASPSLYQAFSEPPADARRRRRVERALGRYLSRMVGRATPFGLLASCTAGTVGEGTRLCLEGLSEACPFARYDTGWLSRLSRYLARHEEHGKSLRFRPNSSLHESRGQYRYLRSTEEAQGFRAVEIEQTAPLRETLERSKKGSSAAALAAALVDPEEGITREDAEAFITELIRDEFLVPTAAPVLTSTAPVEAMLLELRQSQSENPNDELAAVVRGLEEGSRLLGEINSRAPGASSRSYSALRETLSRFPVAPQPSRAFQVDLYRPAREATIGVNVVAELLKGVDLLHRLDRHPHPGEIQLGEFQKAFEQRFGDREIPLAEALDGEAGVGYPVGAGGPQSYLTSRFDFPARAPEEIAWGRADSHLLVLLTRALASGAREIALGPQDLEKLAPRQPRLPLPKAFSVFASLAAERPEDVDRGNFEVLFNSVSGPSGVRMLSRFCHLDPQLKRGVEAHIAEEEALEPDALFAEVLHLPLASMGNVLLHDPWRRHEIPYLGAGALDEDAQIPLEDLSLAVRGGRLVLRSRSHGREVRPRLSHAHAFRRSPVSVYRFLGDFQAGDALDALRWSWGVLGRSAFLPRVRCGRIILARAQWRVEASTLKPLVGLDPASLVQAADAWRRDREIPRWVYWVDAGGGELLVDWSDPLSIENLVHGARTGSMVQLVEMFPPPNRLLARSPEGRFVHEFVVPFVESKAERPSPQQPVTQHAPPRSGPRQPRSFPPGSEWLYLKIYTPPRAADRLLVDRLAPAIRRALDAGAAEGWFFLRYADPDFHLRVRFRGEPKGLWAWFQDDMSQVLSEARDAHGPALRMSLETYEREIPRYGGDQAIALAEEIFHADSEWVLNALSRPETSGEDSRWRLAMLGVAELLEAWGLGDEEKVRILERLRTSFREEHNLDRESRRRLGKLYRELL
ncbi:MAG: lantibiotic dehydratase, partial [Acidobacteriota bacterium]